MDDRKITMHAIRYLAQVAEAINFRARDGLDANALHVSERCADHVEHIAQYDIEQLPLKVRMRGVAESMEWLIDVVIQFDRLLSGGPSNVPTSIELAALAEVAAVVGLD